METQMNAKTTVFIEIERNSNIKYEFSKEQNQLIIDRILPRPYVYPYSYGFIPNTLAMDDDELDALIITNMPLMRGCSYPAYIVGVLIMEDEKGLDEKILCVLEKDYADINDINHLSASKRSEIFEFFSNYKKSDPGRWSKVHGFENQQYAIQLYEKYRQQAIDLRDILSDAP